MIEHWKRLTLGAVIPVTVAGALTACGDTTTTETPAGGTPTEAATATQPLPTNAPTATQPQGTEPPTPTDPPPTEPPTDPATPQPTPRPTPRPTPTQVPVPSFSLDRSSPETGAWGVATGRQFVVYFNEPFPQSYNPTSSITLALAAQGGGTFSGQATALTEDSLGLRFSMNLAADTRYTFDVEVAGNVPVDDGDYSGWFTTAIPCGVGFDLASETRDLTFTQFGDAGTVELRGLNGGINSVPQDLVAIFDGVYSGDTLPREGANAFTVVAGSILPDSDAAGSMDQELGFSGSAEGCTIGSGGNLYCTAPLMALPINTGATNRKELAYMYLRGVSFSGTVNTSAGWQLTAVNMTGFVTERDMAYFMANAGPAVGGVLNPLVANNGNQSSYDGQPATPIALTATPEAFALNGCNTAGMR